VAAGGQAADTPASVARKAWLVVTMVPDSPDVEAVLEGPDGTSPLMGSAYPQTVELTTR